jgi:multidrug efflux pump subunit AcrA (membrane-fusion protein)
MSRSVQPEPAAPATRPAAGPEKTRTAGSAPAAVDARAGTAWSRWVRKPYVVLPALVVLAVVVGLGMGALGGAATPSSSTAQVATVTRGPMTQTVSAQGTVAAAQTDNLSFGSSGTVTAVDVKAGDAVHAGQVLATIDSAQLQANLASAQAAVAKADAQLADDQSSGVSADRLAVDEASVASANDQLSNAQTGLNAASLVATLDGVVSQVNVTAGEQLAGSGTGGTSTTGSATGSGNSSASTGANGGGSGGTGSGFGGRNGGSGGNAGASSSSSGSSSSSSSSGSSSSSSPNVQVVSKNSYVVQLPVASADVSSVKAGQTATLTVTASTSTAGFGGRFPGFSGGGGGGAGAGAGGGGQRGGGQGGNGQSGNNPGGTSQRGNGQAAAGTASATGTVTDVAQVATASTGVAQYPVTVAFTAGSNQIFVGSTVTGAIGTNTRNDVLQVPARAVTATNGTPTVTVRHNGQNETRTVKTGLTANGMVEITSGLTEGEQVVVPLPTGLRGLGTGSAPSGQNTITRGGTGGP